MESLLGGGRMWEDLLIGLLGRHYRIRFRRDWVLSKEPPHYFNHRIGIFELAFARGRGPYPYARAFFTAEILRDGDQLLDIGCGDGFFDRRFFAERCAHIDALDIEPTALEAARRHQSAPNITYYLQDAVEHPFPTSGYDVIVWDGAIGHFSAETMTGVLKKIAAALASGGIFTGSEELQTEAERSLDHLQVFPTLEHLYQLFKPYFKYVELRQMTYRIGTDRISWRKEAYWRCANDLSRLRENAWIPFPATQSADLDARNV
jgi:2-polyprenyl-3-methyl-5-hydroxy-6-metoxy-1,4-benzoquinol methylase